MRKSPRWQSASPRSNMTFLTTKLTPYARYTAMLRFAAISTVALFAALPCFAADPKRDDSASEKLGIKLSLQCWTLRQLTFFETVDKAAGLGVKYLEMFPGQKLKPGSDTKVDRNMSDETIAEVKKKLADA